MIKKLKSFWNLLSVIESEKINAMIYSGSSFN